MSEYRIIYGNRQIVEYQVNVLMEQGYILQGNIQMILIGQNVRFVQVMVK